MSLNAIPLNASCFASCFWLQYVFVDRHESDYMRAELWILSLSLSLSCSQDSGWTPRRGPCFSWGPLMEPKWHLPRLLKRCWTSSETEVICVDDSVTSCNHIKRFWWHLCTVISSGAPAAAPQRLQARDETGGRGQEEPVPDLPGHHRRGEGGGDLRDVWRMEGGVRLLVPLWL